MKQICPIIFMLMGLVATSQTPVPFLKKNGKYIFVDKVSLKPVSEREFDDGGRMVKGLAAAMIDGKWGFIDSLGNEVVPIQYDEVERFVNDVALVKLNDQWGLVNKRGKELVEPQFEKILPSGKGTFMFLKDGKYGLLDKFGKELMAPKYDDYDNTSFLSDQLTAVIQNSKWGYINKLGAEKIPLIYEDAYWFHDGLASVNIGHNWGFINEAGEVKVPIQYDNGPSHFNEGFGVVKLNGKYGFYNKKGKLVIPLIYDFAAPFSEGLAVVQVNDKLGYINPKGKVVIPLKYDAAGKFQGGVANVTYGIKTMLIDKSETEIVPQFYQSQGEFFHEGLLKVQSNDQWGFVDKTGKVIVELKYDEVTDFDEGIAKVKREGKWGFLDKTGNEFVPPKYDKLEEFEYGVVWAVIYQTGFFVDRNGREYREDFEIEVPEGIIESNAADEDSVATDPRIGMGGFFDLFSKLGGKVTTTTIINGDTVVSEASLQGDSTTTNVDVSQVMDQMTKMMSGLLTAGQTDLLNNELDLKADTLVLREIDGYCKSKKSTLCVCYSNTPKDSITNLINKRGSEVSVLVIENPSKIITDLPLGKLTNLKVFFVFGNDADELDKLPTSVLGLRQLKKVSLERVELPEAEKKRISQKYPGIEFSYK